MKALLLLLVAGCATTAQGATSVGSDDKTPNTVFDITTVYNILGEDTSLEHTGLSYVPPCYAEGTACDWESLGWNKSDSNYASAPFPLEGEIHKATFKDDDKPTIIRLTTKKFAISISSTYFEIYLMAEENIEISDMLVLRFTTTRDTNDAYRCLQTLAGNEVLPKMPGRRCTKLNNFKPRVLEWNKAATFNSLSVEMDGDVIKVVHADNQQVVFKMDLAKEFREMAGGAINYVGIESYWQFKYSIPVDLLALSRRRGTLISPLVNYHCGATPCLVCLQMSIYVHPESGGSVAMSLKFTNGTNLNAGKITTSNDKVRLWRLMTSFHASESGFRVHIEATKNNTRPVVITGISNCNASGEFDNVLYDHRSPVQIHLRTNARGLPVLLPDGRVTSPKAGISQIPECVQNLQGCDNWVQNNFTRGRLNASHSPLLNIGKFNDFMDWISKDKQITKSQRFIDPIRFRFYVTRSDSSSTALYVLLMDERGDVASSDMYLILLQNNNYGSPRIYKCTQNDKSGTVNIPGGTNRYCSTIHHYNFYNSFATNAEFTFEVENVAGRIVLRIDRSLVFDYRDPSPISTSRFALGSANLFATITGITDIGALSLSQPTGSLAGPPLAPALDHICVSLLYFAAEGATIDLVLQEDTNETRIGSFISEQPRQSDRCLHSKIIAQIPRKSRGVARLVIKATKLKDTELLIQRVAGCDGLAPEDLTVLERESTISAIDVPRYFNYSSVKAEACPNGGLRYKEGKCVCRPGFTGLNCSEGCGPNSYGADCGGVCSESVHGCKGMVLCKPVIGCACAPGFKGHFCATPCGTGEYGAGCQQRCGHCAEESCDIYTGECHHGCRNGRYPPFCHGLYAYITNSPIVSVSGFYEAKVMANLDDFNGHGQPYLYQVQYKKFNETDWQLGTPQLYSERMLKRDEDIDVNTTRRVVGTLTGLEPGTEYLARVVLIDSSLVSYQGHLVPVEPFTTPCTVPKEKDYLYYEMKQDSNEMAIASIDEEGFEVSWNISRGNVTWCALIGYEIHVKADWRQLVYPVSGSDVTRKMVADLSPGRQYTVSVRGITGQGATAFARAQTVTTAERAPGYVRRLALAQAAERSLKVVWDEPRHVSGRIRRYQVDYRCLQLGACPGVDCGATAGQVEVMTTSALLEDLLPYARYNISVAGVSSSVGLSSSIQAVTSLGVPGVAPSSDGATDVVSRTNSSLTVRWAPPGSCRHLNGYLTGYRYELFRPGQASPLLVGTTTNSSASFVDLVPHSDYIVRVVATNSAGWGTSHVLEIPAKTRATTPEVVENLTVYKRGRRMLGVRWMKPRMTYGALESFTVTHRPLDGARKKLSVTVDLTPCAAWPHLYCHTINNLKADADYTVAVQARNSEVSENGDEVTITATTKEGAPTAPSFLRVVNKTDTEMTVEWGLPDLINGQLRSFLVNVEETDSHDPSDCCQYFPLREVMATEERPAFQFKITGLRAASTYEVGVSAKTVSLGPAVSLTAHTRPRIPVLTHAPRLIGPAQAGKTLKMRVQPSVDYQGDVVRGYMLLLKADTTNESSPISDEWLSKELSCALNGSFSLAAEFNYMDIPKDGIVTMEAGQPLVDGVFGSVGINALVTNTTYRPVWVLVLEYCNTLSMGYVLGDTFSVTEA